MHLDVEIAKDRPVGVRGIAAAIAEGRVSSREVVKAYLDRIAKVDGEVEAWAFLDPDSALAQADAADRRKADGALVGPLNGVPIGVKDIVDTADMPTENGTAVDAGRRPVADATLVARLREAGAVVMGKTTTTELAYYRPSKTKNPRRLTHTPGGSSAGSAAAVAAGMVPAAIGSQTNGSVIRPASFCGVVGFKPSFGLVSRAGVLALSPELDTMGVMALTVEDAALVVDAIRGPDPADPATLEGQPGGSLLEAAQRDPAGQLRLAIARTPSWEMAEDDVAGLFEELESELADRLVPASLPAAAGHAVEAQRRLMVAGFAEHFAERVRRGRHLLSDQILAAIEDGERLTADELLEARRVQEELRSGLDGLFGEVDALLTPAAPGTAPEGLIATGSPIFNGIWTLYGGPAITIPIAEGRNGLPLGLQLVGRRGADGKLLAIARMLWEEFSAGEEPA